MTSYSIAVVGQIGEFCAKNGKFSNRTSAKVWSTEKEMEVNMFNPGVAYMLSKIEQAERLKEAEERRVARIAQGDAQQPSVSWRMIADTAIIGVSAAAAAVSLVLLAGARW
jgi:hypothetical protein